MMRKYLIVGLVAAGTLGVAGTGLCDDEASFFCPLGAVCDGSFMSVVADPGCPHPEQTLSRLVRDKSGRGENHFCVVGYHLEDGSSIVWTHWQEGNAIILWEPTVETEAPVVLAQSRRYLRLDRDVVATDDDVGASTYLVSRAWVDGILGDCEAHGIKFVVMGRMP